MNSGGHGGSDEKRTVRAIAWSFASLLLIAAAIAVVASVASGGSSADSKSTRVAAAGEASPLPTNVTPPDSPDPNAPVVTTTLALPDCIGVTDHFGTRRGCVKRDDLYPPDGSPSTATKVPVWDEKGNQVGYLIRGNVGFVDKATGDDANALADVQACFDAGLKTEPVSSHCSQVLSKYGVRPLTDASS
jgi:ABC-type transport system substrate-binding protein